MLKIVSAFEASNRQIGPKFCSMKSERARRRAPGRYRLAGHRDRLCVRAVS
jgi:hypothetical protein